MLAETRLAGNKFLEGLVSRFGAEAVEDASIFALGYPATLVGTAVEAIGIKQYLENGGQHGI